MATQAKLDGDAEDARIRRSQSNSSKQEKKINLDQRLKK
jgi:hypothetical protein